jgi:hypothetical protein
MNIDSPFEQWRLKYMKGMAASRDIMELLALAFEGGRVAEREACARVCLELTQAKASGDSYEDGAVDCAAAIRARGEK